MLPRLGEPEKRRNWKSNKKRASDPSGGENNNAKGRVGTFRGFKQFSLPFRLPVRSFITCEALCLSIIYDKYIKAKRVLLPSSQPTFAFFAFPTSIFYNFHPKLDLWPGQLKLRNFTHSGAPSPRLHGKVLSSNLITDESQRNLFPLETGVKGKRGQGRSQQKVCGKCLFEIDSITYPAWWKKMWGLNVKISLGKYLLMSLRLRLRLPPRPRS